jgi:hypothetical protein
MAAEDIRSVETVSGDSLMNVELAENGSWVFPEFPGLPVHPGKMQAFLTAMTELEAMRFIAPAAETEEDRRRFGLHRPGLILTVADSGGTTESLVVGQSNPAEGIAYVQRLRDGNVLGVDFRLLAGIFKFRADLSDRRIRWGFAGKTTRFEIATAISEPYVMEKRQASWRLQVPNAPARLVPEGLASLILRQLEELEWESQLGESPGIDPMEVYRLYDEGGNLLLEYEIIQDEFGKVLIGAGEEYYYPRQAQFAEFVGNVTEAMTAPAAKE